jgi:hypothetical protein
MSTRGEERLAAMMVQQTENPPPSRVDIAQLMRDGHRRRRRTRFAQLTAGLAVLGLVAGVFAYSAVAISLTRVPALQVGSATPSQLPAPVAFNPLRLHLGANWVPDGLVARPPVLSRAAQQIWYSDVPAEAGNHAGNWVDITLYASGITPWQLSQVDDTHPRPKISPAQPVNGGVATRFTYDSRIYGDGLAWKWAPDAWAVVRAETTDKTEREFIERRVASNVKTDVDTAISLPFTASSPPSGMVLSKVELREEDPWYSYALEFSVGPSLEVPFPIDPAQHAHDDLLIFVAQTGSATRKPEPDRILGGHPAALNFDSKDVGSVVLYDVLGYKVAVDVSTQRGRQLVGAETAIVLALSVRPLGPPADRSKWTSTPMS